MNDIFKYAPGRPGIGTKGFDGSIGLQGLSMFFTDFDPVTESGTLNIRIASNETLWKLTVSNLPDGRKYNVGDLFVAQSGETYEITNTVTGAFSKIFANLSSGGFFLPLGVSSTDGYARFFNSNTTPKVIIDNVYTTSGAINYTASPVSIYGIQPQEFARIEYSNVVINSRNPFSVFTSGTVGIPADDAKSIAIVRETSGNTFRIGNLDDAGNLRNVNLTFDVSLLSQTKQAGNSFNKNTPSGAILTNYEIAANSLFDPAFNPDPASFTAIFNTGTLSALVSWNLADFTDDTDVTGTLYFLTSGKPYSGVYAFDAVTYKPLVFQDVQTAGSVTITNLSLTNIYTCYMKLSTPNGWIRNSVSRNAFAATITVAPSSFVHNVSDAQTDTFNVTSNVAWVASFIQNPEGMMTINSSTMFTYDGSLNIDVAANASTNGRSGIIRVSPTLGGLNIDVSIYQPRGLVGPELSLIGNAKLQSTTWPYYTLDASRNGNVGGVNPFTIDVSSNRAWTLGTLPSWVTSVTPSSGLANVSTPIAITLAVDSSIEYQRQDTISFLTNPGSTPFGYLTIAQRGIEAWIEHNSTRYNFGPLSLNYISGSNTWLINGVSQGSSSMLAFNMRFTDGVAVPWVWDSISSPWISFTDRSGTGNAGGPTVSAMGVPVGGAQSIGNIGGIHAYPYIFIITGS